MYLDSAVAIRVAMLLLLALALNVRVSAAATVSFAFSGQITSGSEPALGIHIGDPITGIVTYDSEAPPTEIGNSALSLLFAGATAYQQSPIIPQSGVQLAIGGQDFSSSPARGMVMVVGDDVNGGDVIGISYSRPLPPNVPNAAGDSVYFILRLIDSTGTALSSEELPTTIAASEFDQMTLDIGWLSLTKGAGFSAVITSFTPVPEPATSLLAICGVLLATWPVATMLRRAE